MVAVVVLVDKEVRKGKAEAVKEVVKAAAAAVEVASKEEKEVLVKVEERAVVDKAVLEEEATQPVMVAAKAEKTEALEAKVAMANMVKARLTLSTIQ